MNNTNNWRQTILPLTSTFEDVLKNMSRTGLKIVMFIKKNQSLKGIISDGDIRRGLLEGFEINSTIDNLINKNPLVLSDQTTREFALKFMITNHVQQVPIIDKYKRLTGLFIWDEISTPAHRKNQMVIMAGGVGSRMRPLTAKCPKPLLPVAGKPMLERIILHAKEDGIYNFIITINYLGHMIEDYFGNGKNFGVNIEYIKEKNQLGTAGALSLIKTKPEQPIIVSNGDLVMDIGYSNMLNFHNKLGASATMGIRPYEWQHPFGVVKTDGPDIIDFKEKPVMKNNVNAGVYILSPETLKELKIAERCDMPSLFQKLAKKNHRVVAFPMHETWLDVGNANDLAQANNVLSKTETIK